ncbi:MAG TPA: TonB-dependent receptor plug domain-containing protein, partial [Caulobacteraceae bacterium]|nr:TonB-dependent receptor plug domain-containing protein [Caulobacteraceae bacterium]
MSSSIIKGFRIALMAGASALAASAAYAQEEAVASEDPAYAEQQTPVSQDAAAASEVEELVVVGSQIRGAQVTGVLPVTVMDADDIQATGASSGDELFRAIPQNGDVAFNEARDAGGQNDARGDTASINLRALGTGNTLVLLNGRRMVPHP